MDEFLYRGLVVMVLVYWCRCWTSHEASPPVSDSQSGFTLWTLQENDGDAETFILMISSWSIMNELLYSSESFIVFRCLSHTKHLNMTCAASTQRTTLTSCRRSAPTTCRASQRAWTRSMLGMTGEFKRCDRSTITMLACSYLGLSF